MLSPKNHQRFGSARVGACAGPLSLLLLPKCPLCLLPLFAFLGIAMPSSTGLWVAAGILITAWLSVLLVAARKHPLVIAAVCAEAAASVVAIGFHSRPLLWIAVLAMTASGVAYTRSCTHRSGTSSLDTPLGEA